MCVRGEDERERQRGGGMEGEKEQREKRFDDWGQRE